MPLDARIHKAKVTCDNFFDDKEKIKFRVVEMGMILV